MIFQNVKQSTLLILSQHLKQHKNSVFQLHAKCKNYCRIASWKVRSRNLPILDNLRATLYIENGKTLIKRKQKETLTADPLGGGGSSGNPPPDEGAGFGRGAEVVEPSPFF